MQGYDMMKRYAVLVRVAVTVAACLPLVAACTVGGAAAGGYVGHETTHSTAGTVGGAVVGGVIGHELGR